MAPGRGRPCLLLLALLLSLLGPLSLPSVCLATSPPPTDSDKDHQHRIRYVVPPPLPSEVAGTQGRPPSSSLLRSAGGNGDVGGDTDGGGEAIVMASPVVSLKPGARVRVGHRRPQRKRERERERERDVDQEYVSAGVLETLPPLPQGDESEEEPPAASAAAAASAATATKQQVATPPPSSLEAAENGDTLTPTEEQPDEKTSAAAAPPEGGTPNASVRVEISPATTAKAKQEAPGKAKGSADTPKQRQDTEKQAPDGAKDDGGDDRRSRQQDTETNDRPPVKNRPSPTLPLPAPTLLKPILQSTRVIRCKEWMKGVGIQLAGYFGKASLANGDGAALKHTYGWHPVTKQIMGRAVAWSLSAKICQEICSTGVPVGGGTSVEECAFFYHEFHTGTCYLQTRAAAQKHASLLPEVLSWARKGDTFGTSQCTPDTSG
ncbi:unnamed protein product [Vitrella brassicaformis CCMP3155]|uniref:Apple domain-containing protein n=2 Tax=Vitrella brassicaformis TaxID=1169539 RepID=A0A0G4ELF9_VITBC|nr:unnamed protein product [Vitrella brassicaformis CCMP3155]|eukprot:CEL98011.1 unnamed protein product [Vitrella brassicaformis CCMP3155]